MQENCETLVESVIRYLKSSRGLNLLEQTLLLVCHHGESCPVSEITGEKQSIHEIISTPSTKHNSTAGILPCHFIYCI